MRRLVLIMHTRSKNIRSILILAIPALTLVLALIVEAGIEDYNYIGVDGCKLCHRSAAKGNQFGKWEETGHSKALETLASEQAKKYGQERGVSDPLTADECLVCHVTAYKEADERKARTYKAEDGVGCESCHGPGSAYKSIPIMREREKSIENGMVIPNEETCLTCHNDKSPSFKGFDYEEMKAKIAHPNPQG